jgi:hypothetical protein
MILAERAARLEAEAKLANASAEAALITYRDFGWPTRSIDIRLAVSSNFPLMEVGGAQHQVFFRLFLCSTWGRFFVPQGRTPRADAVTDGRRRAIRRSPCLEATP